MNNKKQKKRKKNEFDEALIQLGAFNRTLFTKAKEAKLTH